MHGHASQKRRLLATTTLAGLMVATLAAPVMAQETPEEPGFFTMLGRLIFGAGSERVAIDVPQAVTVLNQDDIDREQATTVGDVLERIPGVTTVGSESRWGESFNIRGIGGGGAADEPRIIMQIDGVGKYYEQYRMGSLFSEPEFLKRVEVLRGPSSSTLYGSGAIAGVIAMETVDASDVIEEEGDTFALRQRLQFSDNGNGRLSSSLLAFAPNDQFEALFGYTWRDSDIAESGNGTPLHGTEGISRGLLAKAAYSFGGAHSVEMSYLRDDSSINDQPYNLVDATTTWGTVDRDIQDSTAIFLYNFNPEDNALINLDAQLSYAETAVDMEDAQGTFIPPADYAYETVTLKLENRAEWSGANFENYLTAGFSVAEQDRRAEEITGGTGFSYHPEGTARTTSIYAQNELIFDDRFTIITGLRADHQKMTPGPLVPTINETSDTAYAANLALHYAFDNGWAAFGSASYTERLPVLDEIYDTRATSGGATDAALGTLRAETSRNFELGAAWSGEQLFNDDDSLSFKGVVFSNDLSDQIVRNNAGTAVGAISPTYINLGSNRISGVELEASYETEAFFGSLAYTHLTSTNADYELPADAMQLSLGTRLPDQNLEFGWSVALVEGASDGTPGYGVHDAYALWKPDQGLMDGVGVRLGVSNLFDKQYRSNLQSSQTSRIGRTVSLTLTKTF